LENFTSRPPACHLFLVKRKTRSIGGFSGGQPTNIAELINYQEGSIVSREFLKKFTDSVTIFAFDEGQGLNEHTAPFDALVQVVEGATASIAPLLRRGLERVASRVPDPPDAGRNLRLSARKTVAGSAAS